MTCDEARIGLYALLDGELDVAGNVEVLAHLEHCAGCQEACEAESRLRTVLHDVLSGMAVAPPGLWPAITERIRRERPTVSELRRPRLPVLSRRRLLQLAGTTAAIVVLASLVWLRSTPSAPFLVEELVMDHVQSVLRAQGPVDVASADPAILTEALRQDISFAPRVPTLSREGTRLLGGSVCHLRSTRGIRLTYAVDRDHTASYYQLERTAGTPFPRAGTGRVYVGQADAYRGPGTVLWGDEHYVYALVAELPAESLEALASQL